MDKPIAPAWDRFTAVLQEHARTISIVAVTLIIIVGGVLLNRNRRESRRIQAAETLRQAVNDFYDARKADEPDFRNAVGLLSDVMETHQGSPAAAQAAFYLGHIYYAEGNYAKSLKKYRKASAGLSSDSPFLEIALLDVAYALEAQKKYARARAAYTRVIDLNGGVLKDRAIIGIGRCFEQEGNLKRSVRTYRSMLKRFPNSPWAGELSQRLDLLQADIKGAKTN